MANLIDKVNTVILVMFENRSFDNILGHLSYENLNPGIDGLKKPLSQYQNLYKGGIYSPFSFKNSQSLQLDLPHEHDFVKIQLDKSQVTQNYTMSGFVDAYAQATKINPNRQAEPMGFLKSNLVPISSFLASNFCTCERWFAPLPTSTQPNRTMAFCGESAIFDTKLRLIDIEDSVFDWMKKNEIRWRVYHDGLSFFALYPHLLKDVLSKNFRDYEFLYNDMINEPPEDAPQVIIVEPSYADSPHIGPDHPNDNHTPLAIGWGEDFLRRTYDAVIANPKKWEGTVMIVYYDEHGGFYDHVPPHPVKYTTIGNPSKSFESTGPRIPGIIVSPFVKKASVSDNILDHTSVLQFLAEKFTPGNIYSDSVEDRRKQGIESISAALNNEDVWAPPSSPTMAINVSSALGDNIAVAPTGSMALAFENAAINLMEKEPEGVKVKYPELLQWKDAVDKARP